MFVWIMVMVFAFNFFLEYQLAEKKAKSNLLIAGSTTLNLFIIALAEEFSFRYPEITVVTAGGGSTAGLIAVKKGAIDIAGMSRDMTGLEDDEFTRSYLIGRDGVAIVLHHTNPITDLTLDQLRDIFSGKISNWKDVGGNNASITVCIREEDATTRAGFEEVVMRGEEYTLEAKTFENHKGLGYTIGRDPNAIGYFRGAFLENERALKAITIEQVPYNRLTILSGRYPLTRSFYFVFNAEPKGLAKQFLEFARSPEGQKVMEGQGSIPVF
jgi:phosphate transport system substrate-binding protein